jgi:hypothetical protein
MAPSEPIVVGKGGPHLEGSALLQGFRCGRSRV